MATKRENTGRPVTPKGKKRTDAFLQVAANLFLEHGYDDLRLDDVIAVTGGSKVTLYRQFGNKESLLEAVTEYICAGYERDLRSLDLSGTDVHLSFRRLALALVELALSDRQLQFYRLVMGNSARFPAIGRIWYERGLATVSKVFRDFLFIHLPTGGMSEAEIDAFADVVQGALVFRLMSEAAVLRVRPDQDRITYTVEIVSNIFRAQYELTVNGSGRGPVG
ncbi:TetR/AcrR family transcriptional regulator [Neorhizobium sp. JUb45]|uniref:TetR/AcrR family transcriptional regulator n=1 Tax=Neorhizobium sp. JUb45 TaxID=2485113 RepID=UPI0010E05501|nr:TetR/AcrR family transcriptional regulator [Neorhizobium sp. JUb45]TCQ97180.1 TetR family transcriptional regulator [Neorhizobium sp. JUb45]